MSQPIDDYVLNHSARFLEELRNFIRIPSVSTLPENDGDVRRAAEFVADGLRGAGLENVEIIRASG